MVDEYTLIPDASNVLISSFVVFPCYQGQKGMNPKDRTLRTARDALSINAFLNTLHKFLVYKLLRH